jgi:tetratricopeptide (TPR) repeat protein
MPPGYSEASLTQLHDDGLREFAQFQRTQSIEHLKKSTSNLAVVADNLVDNDIRLPKVLLILGHFLLKQASLLGHSEDIDAALAAHRRLVGITSDEHEGRPAFLHSLYTSLVARYQTSGNIKDLSSAIDILRKAVPISLKDPIYPMISSSLAGSLHDRFLQTKDMVDIHAAIAAAQQASDHIPDTNPSKPLFLSNIGLFSMSSYSESGNPSDLKRALLARKKAADLTPLTHPDKPMRVGIMGDLLEELSWQIIVQETVIVISPEDEPSMPGWIYNLANLLEIRFDHFQNVIDLDVAISLARAAVSLYSSTEQRNHVSYLSLLGVLLNKRFERTADPLDEEEAISFHSQALSLVLAEADDQRVALSVENVTEKLSDRFMRTGDLSDLVTSISILQRTLDTLSDDHPNKPDILSTLATILARAFDRLGDLSTLASSIDAWKRAVKLIPPGHTDKDFFLNGLSGSLWRRFVYTGNREDAETAISSQREAVILSRHNPRNTMSYLSNLGELSREHFKKFGDVNYLEAATAAHIQVASAIPSIRGRAICLHNGAITFSILFETSSDVRHLEAAIAAEQQAVEAFPDGHAQRPQYVRALGGFLYRRFQHLGKIADLDVSITLQQQALKLVSPDQANLNIHLHEFSTALLARFARTGAIADLDACISLQQDAVRLTPSDHADLGAYLVNLGEALRTRFLRLGELADIEQAIVHLKRASTLFSDTHQAKRGALAALAFSLMGRYGRLHDAADLDAAERAARHSLALTPDGHTHASAAHWLLGDILTSAFRTSGDAAQLDAAITECEAALHTTPDGHIRKPMVLNHLAICLLERHDALTHNKADFDAAVDTRLRALELLDEDDATRTLYLANAGSALLVRYEQLGGAAEDLVRAQELLMRAVDTSAATVMPDYQFRAAHELGRLLHRHVGAVASLGAYRSLVDLVPRMVWLGGKLTRRYASIEVISEAIGDAVAAAVDADDLACAVEWMEQGRCITWAQTLQLRTPIDELRALAPSLADELQEVMQQLEVLTTLSENAQPLGVDYVNTAASAYEVAGRRHRSLALRFEGLVQQARELSGLQNFFCPRKFAELTRTADSGPVIMVYPHTNRCDAIIILRLAETSYQVAYEKLSGMTRNVAKNMQARLLKSLHIANVRGVILRSAARSPSDVIGSLLAQIWNLIARPIIEVLKDKVSICNARLE